MKRERTRKTEKTGSNGKKQKGPGGKRKKETRRIGIKPKETVKNRKKL